MYLNASILTHTCKTIFTSPSIYSLHVKYVLNIHLMKICLECLINKVKLPNFCMRKEKKKERQIEHTTWLYSPKKKLQYSP